MSLAPFNSGIVVAAPHRNEASVNEEKQNRDGDDFPGPGLEPFGMGTAHDAMPVLLNQPFCAAMNSSVAATQACGGKTFSVKTR